MVGSISYGTAVAAVAIAVLPLLAGRRVLLVLAVLAVPGIAYGTAGLDPATGGEGPLEAAVAALLVFALPLFAAWRMGAGFRRSGGLARWWRDFLAYLRPALTSRQRVRKKMRIVEARARVQAIGEKRAATRRAARQTARMRRQDETDRALRERAARFSETGLVEVAAGPEGTDVVIRDHRELYPDHVMRVSVEPAKGAAWRYRVRHGELQGGLFFAAEKDERNFRGRAAAFRHLRTELDRRVTAALALEKLDHMRSGPAG